MHAQGDDQRILRYQVVKDLVIGMIAEEGLQPGDKLPSSSELAILAQVSQISVRRALDELERAGRITRHQGVGTFVAQPRGGNDVAKSGGLLTVIGEDEVPDEVATQLLGLKIGMPSAAIASALHLTSGQPVWEVLRRCVLEGAPVIVERSVLPLSLVPALDDSFLAAGGSLAAFLADKYDLVDATVEQYLQVRPPHADEREWLDIAPSEAAVSIQGVSFTAEGAPFNCYWQVYPARGFALFASGTCSHRLVRPRAADDWGVTALGA